MIIETSEEFLSISLKLNIQDKKYVLDSKLHIPLNDLEEPQMYIKINKGIYYIQYDEIGFPLNYKYINEQEGSVHIDYLKNWDNEVCDCLS